MVLMSFVYYFLMTPAVQNDTGLLSMNVVIGMSAVS
jgi:hypothetical protein